MMQILEAGGMEIMTDGERTADTSNPRGYYEWEAIKQLATKPELLDPRRTERPRDQVHQHAFAQAPGAT